MVRNLVFLACLLLLSGGSFAQSVPELDKREAAYQRDRKKEAKKPKAA